MKIYLKDNCIPYRFSAPRPIPLRFQEPANAELSKYISSGIIVPCSEPTEWCSPVFFVPKGDGKRVHRHSDRVVEGFPWCRKIVDDILIWASTPSDLEY